MPWCRDSLSESQRCIRATLKLKATVTKAWEKPIEGMFLGRAIWALRKKALLGVVA
jgi:hypothetical protein